MMKTARKPFRRSGASRGNILNSKYREIGKDAPSLDPVKEFGAWLLWNGISPEAKLPVSRIGIYTDFT